MKGRFACSGAHAQTYQNGCFARRAWPLWIETVPTRLRDLEARLKSRYLETIGYIEQAEASETAASWRRLAFSDLHHREIGTSLCCSSQLAGSGRSSVSSISVWSVLPARLPRRCPAPAAPAARSPHLQLAPSAWVRSATRSAACSIPIDSRIVASVMPRRSRVGFGTPE
jgi:hypothetical protein